MFIDSHCHLEMEEYDRDRKAVIERAIGKGLGYMLTVATRETYFDRAIRIIEQYPNVYAALGIHPHNAQDYSEDLQKRITKLTEHPRVVAWGEIGLDFFRDHSPRPVQMKCFAAQLAAAKQAGLPIIIHSRNAAQETLDILKDGGLANNKIIIHCFSYDLSTAKTVLDMGCVLSISGVITYKNTSLTDIVRHVPLESLLVETDSPFLTPLPHRNRRNEPVEVLRVYEKIAEIQKRSVDDVADVIAHTFTTLFLGEIA